MSSKVPYRPLKNQEDHLPYQPKMTRLLRPPPDLDRKQMIKKGFPVFHKISYSRPLPPSELRNLVTHLKRSRRGKPLPRLEIHIGLLDVNENSIIRFLQHAKYFSEIRFYAELISGYFPGELNLHVSRVLRSIHALPRLKLKLSLLLYKDKLNKHNEDLHEIVTTFNKHRCFTSAHFSFTFGCEFLKRQELISILKHSKSLSKLSLNLSRDIFSATGWQPLRRLLFPGDLDPQLHDVFRALKEIRTLKNCRLCFQSCLLTSVELNDFIPALKDAAQSFNLEFIIDGTSEVSMLGWWQFKRSIRNLSHSHTISAKHTGKLNLFSVSDVGVRYSL